MRVLLFLFVLAFTLALPAFAQDVAAAGAPPLDPKLAKIALHAAGVAAAIRLLVGLLKSPVGRLLWLKVAPPVRVLALVVLGAVAVGLEAVAGGTPILEAVFIALGGVGGAVASAEMQRSALPKKKPPLAAVRG